jgi:hypothetical protein
MRHNADSTPTNPSANLERSFADRRNHHRNPAGTRKSNRCGLSVNGTKETPAASILPLFSKYKNMVALNVRSKESCPHERQSSIGKKENVTNPLSNLGVSGLSSALGITTAKSTANPN